MGARPKVVQRAEPISRPLRPDGHRARASRQSMLQSPTARSRTTSPSGSTTRRPAMSSSTPPACPSPSDPQSTLLSVLTSTRLALTAGRGHQDDAAAKASTPTATNVVTTPARSRRLALSIAPSTSGFLPARCWAPSSGHATLATKPVATHARASAIRTSRPGQNLQPSRGALVAGALQYTAQPDEPQGSQLGTVPAAGRPPQLGQPTCGVAFVVHAAPPDNRAHGTQPTTRDQSHAFDPESESGSPSDSTATTGECGRRGRLQRTSWPAVETRCSSPSGDLHGARTDTGGLGEDRCPRTLPPSAR